MALEDVVLPKEYANARVLFEQNLDAWREAAEESFFTINLNLTQLSKDCFVAGYEFDNDGVANLSQSLEQRINLLAAGATPISGTSSDTFTVNSDGNSGTLSTLSLTDIRTFTFPDLSGVFVLTTGVQNLTSKTFTDNLVFNSGTAFTGTFDHANSANRIWTLPDVAGTLLVIGQADWDSLWTDAVHDHSSNAEGGQLDWDTVWADAVHDHSSSAEGGNLSTAALTSGTLPVARGGTGVTTSTGSGNVVLSDSPTFGGTGILLPNNDPPVANRFNLQSGIKASAECLMSANTAVGYNISSSTHAATGLMRIDFDTDFTDITYPVSVVNQPGAGTFLILYEGGGARALGAISFVCIDNTLAGVDTGFCFIAGGIQ